MPKPRTTVPDPASETRYFAERLLGTVRQDIGRADTKAAVLLSAALALPALLLDGRQDTPARSGVPAIVLLSAAGLLWIAGGAALVLAILPRTGTRRDERAGVTFFGDLLRPGNVERLAARLAEAGGDPVGWLLVQAVDVGSILAAKYRCIRWGVGCLAPAVLLAVAGTLAA